jgi:hypothetical protein
MGNLGLRTRPTLEARMTNLTTMALTVLAARVPMPISSKTLQFALQRLMDMDVEALCRAAYG